MNGAVSSTPKIQIPMAGNVTLPVISGNTFQLERPANVAADAIIACPAPFDDRC